MSTQNRSLVVWSLLVVAFVGCGRSDNNNTGKTTAQPPLQESAEAVRLRIERQAEEERQRKLKEAFERRKHATVNCWNTYHGILANHRAYRAKTPSFDWYEG